MIWKITVCRVKRFSINVKKVRTRKSYKIHGVDVKHDEYSMNILQHLFTVCVVIAPFPNSDCKLDLFLIFYLILTV